MASRKSRTIAAMTTLCGIHHLQFVAVRGTGATPRTASVGFQPRRPACPDREVADCRLYPEAVVGVRTWQPSPSPHLSAPPPHDGERFGTTVRNPWFFFSYSNLVNKLFDPPGHPHDRQMAGSPPVDKGDCPVRLTGFGECAGSGNETKPRPSFQSWGDRYDSSDG
jgi:hypothetical protein